MVILLQGGSRIGRAAIAGKIVKDRKQWRHLSIEDVQAAAFFGSLDWDDSADVLFTLACACAHEMLKEKYHILVSCEDAPEIIRIFREEFPKRALAARLQSNDIPTESMGFDIAFNGKKSSAQQVAEEILRAMKA